MTPKPHRVLIDRVSGYASEAAAYVRRRRQHRKPFARTLHAGGRGVDHPLDRTDGARMLAAAEALIAALETSESEESEPQRD